MKLGGQDPRMLQSTAMDDSLLVISEDPVSTINTCRSGTKKKCQTRTCCARIALYVRLPLAGPRQSEQNDQNSHGLSQSRRC